MGSIVAWQLVVAVSLAASRVFSSKVMIRVAVVWTAFTFLMVWASWLINLQLVTIWGTVGLLVVFFGKRARVASKPEPAGGAQLQANASFVADSSIIDLPSSKAVAADAAGAVTTAATETRSVTAIVASLLEEGARVVEPPDTMLKGLRKALDDISAGLQTNAEKMEANREISMQLRALKSSVEFVFRIVGSKRETQQMLASDPAFAKHYDRISERVREEVPEIGIGDKCELRTLTEAPKRAAELPPLAAEERVIMLTESLDLLASAIARVTDDGELSKEIDKLTQEAFLPFLRKQHEVLSEHLKLLKETSGQDRTTHRSPADDDILPPTPREIGEKAPGPLKTIQPSTADRISALLSTLNTTSLSGADQSLLSETIFREFNLVKRREAIQNYAREIAIPHLVHFTRCENLPGILDRGLMSISTCSKEGVAYVRNDEDRRDGHPNGISLSIAFPNYLMFYKYRMQTGVDWAVLLISPSVLWEKDCAFYRHNAADARVSREPLSNMKTPQAFRDMFSEEACQREAFLCRFDPSDPQAEILVFETVPSTYIKAAAFETREAHARYAHLMDGIETFYTGGGKGFFGSRSRARRN